jgi:curli biogenesis system outer membrane secretion channel CsgG
MDFNIENIPKNQGIIIVELLGSALFETKKFRIIERTQRLKILKEIAFSFDDCVDETCQIEAGRLLAANKIVVGSVAIISSRFIFNTKLIDVETGETISIAINIVNTMDELIDSTAEIAEDLSNY